MNMHVPETLVAARPSLALRWRKSALIAAPLLAIAAGIGATLVHEAPAASSAPVPVVTVAQPLVRNIDQWDDYVGRFAASQAVEVRPRVGGAITAIHFHDGQMVAKGQLLFTVDPRPYQAALAEAQAGVASARSALSLARSDYQRAVRLQADDAIAASEVETLRSRVTASEAALAAAEARVRARALDMEFTQVRAPIAGRISDRRIDVGNLVSGGEGTAATLLTTINALDPIYFAFDASEGLFLKAKRQQAGGGTVEVRLQDETGYRWKGKLDFTDNGVDPRSGTIRGRAVIANPDGVLTPGLFGNMRMGSGRGRALLVPDTAIQTDQASKLVLVVGRDDKVEPRIVKLGPVVDGLRVINAGLKPGERVVIGGIPAAAPGAKVQPKAGSFAATPDTSPAAAASSAGEATLASN
ncbi:efflux RND transporter periplasmic adaptor subunit [Sphingomonas sp. dw_22]|uniref:efflux RND transporter periplasmic adaptor subunit n=1 Tax=Sphingomonas sp. dw_22 TaxID=2721175 RepID=UPI001BD69CCB|nr:efflux RND transporter periplasmic adaptor subunit [Sphingomonas sp. dw_22]